MASKKNPTPSTNKSISINGDVKDSTVIAGDNNTVNQTIIQKFFNIFKSDSETLEHRNRRILLGHVENAWIKGVLDASLHGAALLDLGIKQDPEAVTKYPWAIQKESTKETLPAGTSMLDIFDSIGMGRSLLILGTPGSGKTTMLLELARQLIARAREDVTYPIPIVFNLASWTEKRTLADWLAQELNNLYSVPRKTAPDWVKGNKLLLLLDGLDEVRQESRAKCVEAINAFRKEHGLTSLAVCSRSQDYADLNTKLSFEGAIEVQSLTQKQIAEFFNRFGKEMAGIKQVLKKDGALREMAETPLFLSIMIMAYRGKQDVDILISQDEKTQCKHLFDTYIERMFKSPRLKNVSFRKQDVLHWLSWLAQQILKNRQTILLVERMRRNWLSTQIQQTVHKVFSILFALGVGLIVGLATFHKTGKLILGLIMSIVVFISFFQAYSDEQSIEITKWSWKSFWQQLLRDSKVGIVICLGLGVVTGFFLGPISGLRGGVAGLFIFLFAGGFETSEIEKRTRVNQGIILSMKNAIVFGLIATLIAGLVSNWEFGLANGLGWGLLFGGMAVINHYFLRFLLYYDGNIPLNYIIFLDYCNDLIFLRRVGGGYIFVHRLLMEHFAEMYVEDNG